MLMPCCRLCAEFLNRGKTTVRHALPGHRTQLILGNVSPTAMLGGVTKRHAADEYTRRCWLKSLVEGPFRMRVQIITDDNDLRCRPVACPQEVGHLVGPVNLGASFAHCDVTPAHQRFAEHKNAGGARALVCIVYATRMPGRPSDWCPRFLQELYRLLIHAEHRIPRIVGLGIDLEHFLHTRRELGIGGRRNDPILDLPVRKMVFLGSRGGSRG